MMFKPPAITGYTTITIRTVKLATVPHLPSSPSNRTTKLKAIGDIADRWINFHFAPIRESQATRVITQRYFIDLDRYAENDVIIEIRIHEMGVATSLDLYINRDSHVHMAAVVLCTGQNDQWFAIPSLVCISTTVAILSSKGILDEKKLDKLSHD